MLVGADGCLTHSDMGKWVSKGVRDEKFLYNGKRRAMLVSKLAV